MNETPSIRLTSARYHRTEVIVSRVADPVPLTVTDDVLFRWARIVQIAKLFPIMNSIRALEYKIQTGVCRNCHQQHRLAEIDRSALDTARRQLAECADDRARFVKEAAGIRQYRITYHDLTGTKHEVTR
jgi:hypothetical protein